MAAPTKRKYEMSPFGEALHPWLNKPDTKFDDGGEFKVDLLLEGEVGIKFMEKIKAESDRAFEEMSAEMTPGERKKWSVYYPFEELEDDQGDKTGVIKFKFRQNHTIILKDKTEKKIELRLQDGNAKDTTRAIFGGSTIRTMFACRDIKMTSAKQFGVRLDFCGAQVTKFGTGNRSGGGFAAVEGYEDDGADAGGFTPAAASSGGDY